MSDPISASLRELAQIADLMGPALAPTTAREMLAAITRTARELFGAAACSLALLTDDESELVFTSVSGAGETGVSGLRIPSSVGIAGWVVMSGQPIAVADLQHDARFADDVAAATGYVPTTILAVPVQTSKQMLGVVELLDRDESRAESGRDMELLGLFAGVAALAIESERVFSQFGRVLFRAAAMKAPNASLAQSLQTAAAQAPDDLGAMVELASVVAELRELGPAERRLAVAVIGQFNVYARGRHPRPG